jgi:cytochrome P460
MKRTGIIPGAVASCAVLASLAVAAPKTAGSGVDAAGNLHVPSDYAARYEYLGTWAVAADEAAGSKEMHIVYASPGAIAAFKSTGHFPQGTVLVKEVRETTTASMTTGTVSHPTKLKGWFVSVRDVKNSHPGNKLWGDGWGWSWFDADKPLHTTSTDYHNDCLGCHQPAKATDWMYTPGYSTLQH